MRGQSNCLESQAFGADWRLAMRDMVVARARVGLGSIVIIAPFHPLPPPGHAVSWRTDAGCLGLPLPAPGLQPAAVCTGNSSALAPSLQPGPQNALPRRRNAFIHQHGSLPSLLCHTNPGMSCNKHSERLYGGAMFFLPLCTHSRVVRAQAAREGAEGQAAASG